MHKSTGGVIFKPDGAASRAETSPLPYFVSSSLISAANLH